MLRQRLGLRLLHFLLLAALLPGVLPCAALAEGELHVLWIGNSYTARKERIVPNALAELARAGGQRLVQERETRGGWTLEKHWKEGKALDKVRSRKWDFVVLQDHSKQGIKDRQALDEYARKFDAEIRKQGGKTLLYLAWAYQDEPETQGPISKAHLELADQMKVRVAPVGIAWERARAADGQLALFEPDRLHPNQAGIYLSACVFYSTLFGESPERLRGKVAGLGDEEARRLRKIAWQAVQDSEGVRSTPPPAGAMALFNGKDLGGWVQADGKTRAGWKVLEGGVLQVGKGNIRTARAFAGPFKLHVEFRVPYLPDARGQKRGNSGVYVQGRYEVQILDSYGSRGGAGDCGAIYTVAAPLVNACKVPTVWQSYDIDFQPPKCEGGKKVETGTMSVWHNGVRIHDRVPLTKDNTVGGLGGDPCEAGPIMLQENGSAVQFRNLWLLPK